MSNIRAAIAKELHRQSKKNFTINTLTNFCFKLTLTKFTYVLTIFFLKSFNMVNMAFNKSALLLLSTTGSILTTSILSLISFDCTITLSSTHSLIYISVLFCNSLNGKSSSDDSEPSQSFLLSPILF